MKDNIVSIKLSEWETLSPDNCPELRGHYLDEQVDCQKIVESVNDQRKLQIRELKNGLEITSFSYVGRISIGNLNITIHPKLKSVTLLRLLRYAFGFRRLKLITDSPQIVDQCGFEDLLISQLNSEARELISRGLQRKYIRQNERLASPRGRIDINKLALDSGTVTATLPCQHHPRLEDTLSNQVLLAGLHLAGSLASLVELRRESRRLASLMEEQISSVKLNAHTLELCDKQMTRLDTAYKPALSIIRLLIEAQGISFAGKSVSIKLPGFLFDMNMFFQELLSRFLRENLEGYTIRDEHTLKGMMKYHSEYNPQHKPSPNPRPDYAVLKEGRLHSLLDAKYRDIWEKSLPRGMLYQLVIYAISLTRRPQSSIVYPTTNIHAKESRIDVTDPMFGKHIGQVCLRPVNLIGLEELVSSDTAQNRRERAELASKLVFGE